MLRKIMMPMTIIPTVLDTPATAPLLCKNLVLIQRQQRPMTVEVDALSYVVDDLGVLDEGRTVEVVEGE
jgi:hypothetical protein